MKHSSGTLLYRHVAGEKENPVLEVLLVHPSGNYNRRAPWGIPKGLPDPSESLEETARRETLEETGVRAAELHTLGHVDYTRSRKRVYAFAGRAPFDAAPTTASWEVDKAEFVPLERANQLIHADQRAFLARLVELLEAGKTTETRA
jgi:predicted NUDIX family NTP pyrophosphohydrolase